MACDRRLTMPNRFRRGRARGARAALAVAAALLLAGGCARQPPSQFTLSGIRLRVTLTFNAAVNPGYYYFFLINNAGSPNAPGPIAVLLPPYGYNGFATASDGSTNGFSDYVEFTNNQPQSQGGYELYHVVHTGANVVNKPEAGPISFVTPDPNDPGSYNKLQFDIDLAQLIYDANGNPLPDPAQTIMMAQAIRYLQINVVATNLVPTSPTPVAKATDSLGQTAGPNGQPGSGVDSFLNIDLQSRTVFQNGDPDLLFEPTGDVFGGSDPSLDITDYRIELVHT